MLNFLQKFKENLTAKLNEVLSFGKKVDEELFEELEEALILADVGVDTTYKIIQSLKQKTKEEKIFEASKVRELLAQEIYEILQKDVEPFVLTSPMVILIVGVNGVGKTTTIGKLAHLYKKQGKSVMMVAADTFRAAAIDQLEVWAKRVNCPIIKHQEGSDPASVVFDGLQSAKARGIDVVICDTAGRLHNKKNLMEELRKIRKVIDREYSEARVETFLVLDATTGQNALQQAKIFKEVADITGIILTKLDGTAKGGIVIAIKEELNLPIRYIGIGEGMEDLQAFDAKSFVSAIFQ
ncbi:MAG: Signal recognition particle receptor FtsY [Caldanaerobacter subterraneus]|jgi:fused signal recognition particle receptor|uniref:Signal recognition particle receptor FtsY n=4 Tax=Caldanaerobacter subterraneus TaxID=911092 RepID=Q8R9W8_CALS4|nr:MULTISPECIES: signal recognition particle-docking protein FtsY [Caldanaerobacter]AAM24686.1 Signal recognition particle GTPase [Caldanaerobacter subterraneus subsp. tengcongensis MB4]ERM92421.1 cell division protein FtsY [Caldanaerobacter subterraneus subsp. yonseiensis KB-1]KKC29666.1 Signal recognition particle GTPase [Caldanaerobacter subterraneus subsp. pacificus DSM 12653]KUK09903.1 MAG: Signal recognition particle receptor FtsY [Caldanaerobacter subterraneus]MBE3579211.1 signal recogn